MNVRALRCLVFIELRYNLGVRKIKPELYRKYN